MPILIPLIFNIGTSGRLVGNLFQREQKRLIARPTQPQKKDKENEKNHKKTKSLTMPIFFLSKILRCADNPKEMLKYFPQTKKESSNELWTVGCNLSSYKRCIVVTLICCLLFSQAFRDVISDDGVLPEPTKKLLFSTFDPIYEFHCSFLSELEQRMNFW